MKNLRLVLFFSALFLITLYPLSVSYSSNSSPDLGLLHISLIDGDVQVKTEESDDWVPASINMPLREGDRLWVPEEGKVELRLIHGTYIRLNERSSLEVLTLGKDSFQFFSSAGHVYVNFRSAGRTVLQMDTPLSSLRVYSSSKFKVDVSEEGATEVSVLTGLVHAESRAGTTKVNGGKALTIAEGVYAELSPLDPPDEWELWNKQRDRKISERRYSYQYLPDELAVYSYDFDNYGEWVYVRKYHYVWRPTFYISVGWAPYRVGRWVWIAGDYVWVSYEPWGWAPYHYGRWAFIVNIGWCWVPPVRGAVYWGPGFVGWVYTPTYVAWVPLAPGDIYYGHRHYGPHSVNIRNVDINVIKVKEYKNVNVINAVTVINRNSFVAGKHESIKVKENPFHTEKIHPGRPPIKPVKESSTPIVKKIPIEKEPPKKVKEIHTKELKEKRPFVKNRSKSVLAPQAPQRNMPYRTIKEPKGISGKDVEEIPQRKLPVKKERRETVKKERELEKPTRERAPKDYPETPGAPGEEKIKRSKPQQTMEGAPAERHREIEKPRHERPVIPEEQKPRHEKPVKEHIKKQER